MATITDYRSATDLRDIFIFHSKRYPLWNEQDLYKLIHQAAMGSEHAVFDDTRAREWLLGEIRNLGDGPEEPLVDSISPNSEIIRVHLRPFVRAKKDVDQLFHAFLRTARDFHGLKAQLKMYAMKALWIAGDDVFPFNADHLAAYFKQMEESDFPPVHHSPAFEVAYRPAYRVVAREFLPQNIITMI